VTVHASRVRDLRARLLPDEGAQSRSMFASNEPSRNAARQGALG
jgi:hypothetical protein